MNIKNNSFNFLSWHNDTDDMCYKNFYVVASLLAMITIVYKWMYWIQTNPAHGFECFFQHLKWSFLINVHVLYVFIVFLSIKVWASIWLFSGLPGFYCYYYGVSLVWICVVIKRFIKRSKVACKPSKPKFKLTFIYMH